MSKLREIFEKPVDRAIEGVIKADDEASLRVELEEYVITNEIERQLERFLDAYNNYGTANGAWISGFFGSGKSHLLKMLALLLENRDVGGSPAYELFKQKCAHNEILAADLRKAVSIPSKSILFNIDQKADVISKEQIDALLSVFQKVFDEMCGYYGKQPHIAQFERDLDSRGLLDTFRAAYQSIAGKPWDRGREQALLESANVAKAYAQATGADPSEGQGILTRYRQDFRSSIEDFADKVKAYKGPTSSDRQHLSGNGLLVHGAKWTEGRRQNARRDRVPAILPQARDGPRRSNVRGRKRCQPCVHLKCRAARG